MKWVTRENVHIDRVACPWLIKNFIDHEARFVFVPDNTDPSTINDGIPFDMKNVELGHHGDKCSFDAFMHKFNLEGDPALVQIQQIVKLADLHQVEDNPMAYALDVLATGFREMAQDDHKTLEYEFHLYDALYAYFKM
jgi:hypothetical protein